MRTIDIVTSNNVTIQYELGSIMQRFLALLLDLVIWGVYSIYFGTLISTMVLSGLDNLAHSVADGSWSFIGYLVVSLLGVLLVAVLYIPVFFYRFLSEYFFNGRTVGKMAVGLRVLKLDGTPPGLTEYFLRSSFMLVDLWACFGSLGFLFSSSSDKNQRLGDMVADTTVIRLRPSVNYSIKDILSIKTSENYEPQYPQVISLTDEDMLLIKNAIDRVRRFPNTPHKQLILDLAAKCQDVLRIEELPKNKLTFLKTLLQDYIVLTRS